MMYWVRNSEIDKTANKLSIKSCILKWFFISSIEFSIRLDGHFCNLTISEICSSKKIIGIFRLAQVETIWRGRNLEPQKITKRAKVFHFKLLSKNIFKVLNSNSIIANDNHVIYIKQKNNIILFCQVSWALEWNPKNTIVDLNFANHMLKELVWGHIKFYAIDKPCQMDDHSQEVVEYTLFQ